MIQVNLLPDVKRELVRIQATRNFVTSISVATGVASLVVMSVLIVLLVGQFAAGILQDKSISNKSHYFLGVEDLNKSATIQAQLKTIDDQHNLKQFDSRLFDILRSVNPSPPNNVKMSLIKLSPLSKTISIEGMSSNGYIALEVLKKTIINTSIQTKQGDDYSKKALAGDFQTGSTSFGEDAEGKKVLRFSFTFTYPDELFAYSDGPLSIITPTSKTDVTDSKIGVPESLFSDKDKDSSKRGAN